MYASLGNHDIWYPRSQAEVTEAFTRVGIQVLWNAIAYPLGAELPIIGLADFWSRGVCSRTRLRPVEPSDSPHRFVHNPDSAEVLRQWRIDLQLSGHTHGGQVNIPGIGPVPILLQQLRQRTPTPLQRWIPFLKKCSDVAPTLGMDSGLASSGQQPALCESRLRHLFSR